jgi:hypothetical protein
MKCDKCEDDFPEDELFPQGKQQLCDNCLMDMMSPAKACDPWAVKAATSSMKSKADGIRELRGLEKKVYELIVEKACIPLEELPALCQTTPKEIERAISVLRHMELLRAAMREDRGKNIVLFDA